MTSGTPVVAGTRHARRSRRSRRGSAASPMTTATALGLLVLILVVAHLPTSLHAIDPQEDSNILFILLDQLRYDALGYVQRNMRKYRNKVTVRTPNIDKLAAMGVSFATTYCQSASCAPCRATIKTGRTVAQHGIIGNRLIEPPVYNLMNLYQTRVTDLVSFEQVLHDANYQVETYGKWHYVPMYYAPVRYNDYSYQTQQFNFRTDQAFSPLYTEALKELRTLGQLGPPTWPRASQLNRFNGNQYPYSPLPTDPRYGMPTNTSEAVLPAWLRSEELGIDTLTDKYTSTAILADMALRALDRLMKAQVADPTSTPFLLSVHFNSPHPPHIVTNSFLTYYQQWKQYLFIPPSLKDSRRNSPYPITSPIVNDPRYLNNNATYVADFTSVYYAMIEEVDAHVGILLDRLWQDPVVANKTLIVFTSDHGEMMGSHGLTGKGNLYEESTRVPLILVHPTKIAPGQVVNDAITQLDLFSTLLDYSVGLDNTTGTTSDGVSLRRYVDKTAFNDKFDERAIVVELDYRVPTSATTMAGTLGSAPNFMVRRGKYKLLITRKATGTGIDALWNVDTDPYEMTNLLKSNPNAAGVIGKAEHLKILLVEWMMRHNGAKSVYTSNYYHRGEGRGDVIEVSTRRTWKRLPYWLSDTTLGFGTPVRVGNGAAYRRNEYLYVGGSQVWVTSVAIDGPNATYFSANVKRWGMKMGNPHFRIQVRFVSTLAVSKGSQLRANVVIRNNVTKITRVPIYFE